MATDKYRSVHTAKKARVTLVARRAELQSELADLHAALIHRPPAKGAQSDVPGL